MTDPKRANEMNVLPCWKVRICLRGGVILHLLSVEEPKVVRVNGQVANVQAEWILHTEHGDHVGFIDWKEVAAVTWRMAPLATKGDR